MTKDDKSYFESKNNYQSQGYRQNNVVEQRPPVRFNNGIVYEGSWLGEYREGFGVQIWPDGARYEGQWHNNKANGKGKFIHVDGDVYDGEWRDDKASGQGTYYHNNGSKYTG